jgi:DNA-binding LacI/PurR family transcriptional regulator
MLDHMQGAGCRRIALFSAYSQSPLIEQMIEHYKLWVSTKKSTPHILLAGQSEETPFLERARGGASHFAAMDPRPDGVLCISELDAIGLSRGLLDHGIEPGTTIHVAALNYEPLDIAPYATPSVTYVKGDPQPSLDHIVQWMARGGGDWIGPCLLFPLQCTIMKGR